VLDFTPNPVHVGIYTALARHFDIAAGVRLHVIAPSASTDAIRLLETGRVNFAILDIHDLAIARERGRTSSGILPIVERPLASVIAAPAVRTPRQLAGKTVGISGDPSDTAVLDSIVAGSGGRPGRSRRSRSASTPSATCSPVGSPRPRHSGTTRGDARPTAPGISRVPRGELRRAVLSRAGAVRHPARSEDRPGLARSVVRALVRGYDLALATPALGQRALEAQVPGLDHGLDTAELTGLRPAFLGPEGHFGVLDLPLLRRWAQWETRFGIVRSPPNMATMFDTRFAPAG